MKSLLLVTALVVGVTLWAAPSVTAQSATYSCGAYGGSNYSEGACASSTPGNSTGDTDQAGIKPPDTGFAKLAQPPQLIALILSVAAILTGIGILVRLRRKQRQ